MNKLEDLEELSKLVNIYYRALSRDPTLEYKRPRPNIHEKSISVYGKSYCPYCQKAHDLVKDRPDAIYIELEEGYTPKSHAHTPHIEQSKTIPIVFINDDYVGGLEELEKILN